MAEKRSREFKVGIFVTVLTVAIGVATFLVGGSTKLFEDRYTLYAAWADVAGLKEGAVVRLAGWDVGEVTAITFSDDPSVQQIFVEMRIMSEFQGRIRVCPDRPRVEVSPEAEPPAGLMPDPESLSPGSVARIETMGVLGDKYVALSMGSPVDPLHTTDQHPDGVPCPELQDGEWIKAKEALDVLDYTKQVSEILKSTASIGNKVDLMLGENQDAARASLATSFSHLEDILRSGREGNGLLHALIYDEAMPKRVDNILANLESASSGLADVTREIKEGDGIATELIYGENGEELAVELRTLANALSSLADDIKSEDSLINSLIYDPEKAQMIDDLAATAASLRAASEAIESGDGTLGLLARDPMLYEDLRALLGGAQRNKLLRAYIRKTVQKGEDVNAGAWQPAE